MIGAAPSGTSVARVLFRAGLLVVAFVIALVVWQALAASRVFPARPLPFSPDVGAALGTSLGPLVLALVLGAAAGVAIGVAGALADRLEVDEPWAGAGLKLAGRLVELPWLAISPFVFAAWWVIAFGIGAGAAAALEVVVIGGLVATLVAAAAYDPLRQGDGAGAALAALGAVGRGLLVGTGALVLIEGVSNRAGLGRLLIESVLVRFPGGPLVTALLVIGLLGSLLSLGGTLTTRPRVGREAADEPPAQRWWVLATLATLALPVLVLLVSFAVARDATPHFDIGSSLVPPSPAHPLGTDQLGQDLLGQLMIGYRTSLGLALGAALVAVVVGGSWGTAAAWTALGEQGRGALADVFIAPAWIIAVLPLLPAAILLRAGSPDLAVAVALGVVLLARLALAVRDLEPPDLMPATLLRAAGGLFLLCVGVAFVAGVGLDAIGVGTAPPTASFGRLLGEAVPQLLQGGGGMLAWVAWLSVLTAGPCFLAAWTLLRPFNRGQTWGQLLA
jgi:peptide/nickel transport system permease protein